MPKGRSPYPLNVPIQGLQKGLPHQVGNASIIDGLNMIVDRDGRYRCRGGYSPLASAGPGARILGSIFYRDTDNTPKLVAATAVGWWSFDFGSDAWTDISGTANTGDANTHVRFVTFQQANDIWAIGVNHTDTMRRWDSTSATYVDITAAPIARDIEVLADRVVCVNTIETSIGYLARVRWSASVDATTWGASNYIDLADSGDPIVGIKKLTRTTAIVYRNSSLWSLVAQPGGETTSFSIEHITDSPGPVSSAAIISVEGLHYYLARDAKVYAFDGVRPRIISDAIDQHLTDNYDTQFNNLTHGASLLAKRQVKWFYVRQDAGDNLPKEAATYNIDRATWEAPQQFADGITDSNNVEEPVAGTWDDMTGTWDSVDTGFSTWDAVPRKDSSIFILGTDAGDIHRFGSNADDNGTAISWSWDLPLIFPDPFARLLVEEVESYFVKTTSSQPVTIGIYNYTQPLDTGTLIALESFDLRNNDRFRTEPTKPFVLYARGAKVKYSGTTSNYANVVWGGGILFINPEQEG